MKKLVLILCLLMIALPVTAADLEVLPLRQQAEVQNQWLQWRLDHLLPQIMNDHDLDAWLVIQREYNEDPVYFTLVPQPSLHSYRTTILAFVKSQGQVQRYSMGNPYHGLYQRIPHDPNQMMLASLADFLKQQNPQRIGIDVSQTWHLADGLSATLKQNLVAALGPDFAQRLVSAEPLCLDWLATRSPQQLEAYPKLCRMAHGLIHEFYSRQVITPGVTTPDDVRWWIRQRISDLGLGTWFHPILDIQRSPQAQKQYADQPDVIQRGDLLHCDIGIVYLGLCTDMQWHAYVLREGETTAPAGLQLALARTVAFNKVLRKQFRTGVTGEQIGTAALAQGKAMGLNPLIYSHSLGTHGHAAGTRVDTRPAAHTAEENPARRTYPVVLNSVYAIEYCRYESIPEWDDQTITISFEEDAVLTESGCDFLDGHQESLILID